MSLCYSPVSLKKTVGLIVFFYAVAFQAGFAAEIDSITPRSLELDDSLATINEIFNLRIKEGIQKTNVKQDDIENMSSDEFCNEKNLYKELRKAIFQSATASWGLKGYDLDMQLRDLLSMESYSLSLNDSIYRDINYLEGFSLNIKELSDVVNINGHLIGLDKMGHFFSEGWEYFELTDYNDKNIIQALEWGKEQEEGRFGYSTTGIFSFSDLAANLNGWRFWNKVLLNENDPLKGVFANLLNQSYVSCEVQIIPSIMNMKIVKAWAFNARFDLSDYVDGAWDEGNNCNSYKDPVIEEKVVSRINNVYPDFSCPHNRQYCADAIIKYNQYAKHVLHPYCLIVNK